MHHKFLMYLDNSLDLHVPVPYWNISAFRHSLGHKLNHSFKKMNTKFGRAYHPRFGNTRAIIAIKDIARDEEILVDYGYELGSYVPSWYAALYKEELGLDWYKGSPYMKQKKQNHNQCSVYHPSKKQKKNIRNQQCNLNTK